MKYVGTISLKRLPRLSYAKTVHRVKLDQDHYLVSLPTGLVLQPVSVGSKRMFVNLCVTQLINSYREWVFTEAFKRSVDKLNMLRTANEERTFDGRW